MPDMKKKNPGILPYNSLHLNFIKNKPYFSINTSMYAKDLNLSRKCIIFLGGPYYLIPISVNEKENFSCYLLFNKKKSINKLI